MSAPQPQRDLDWRPIGAYYTSYQASDGPWDFIITNESILIVINRHNRYTIENIKCASKDAAKIAADKWLADHTGEVLLGAH